jgi:hypothetical protein
MSTFSSGCKEVELRSTEFTDTEYVTLVKYSENNSDYDNRQDNDDIEIEYFYKNGQLQFYLYKGIFYAAEYPEHWVKFQYDLGAMFKVGPAHCHNCIQNGSIGGVIVGPCENCASLYNNYDLGPGFNSCGQERSDVIDENGHIVLSAFELHMKYVDRNSIGRNTVYESEQLDCELLETECNELYHQLIDEHGYEKVERYAIEGLMRFIRSFTNPEEMRQKINTALLIPYSKMYNQNWAGTDWDWFAGQLNKHDDDINRWTFTDEECESIRISQETVCNMLEK